jgi:hypothetical protein
MIAVGKGVVKTSVTSLDRVRHVARASWATGDSRGRAVADPPLRVCSDVAAGGIGALYIASGGPTMFPHRRYAYFGSSMLRIALGLGLGGAAVSGSLGCDGGARVNPPVLTDHGQLSVSLAGLAASSTTGYQIDIATAPGCW